MIVTTNDLPRYSVVGHTLTYRGIGVGQQPFESTSLY
jgi:hypothetical protein